MAILHFYTDSPFQRFLLGISPLVVMFLVGLLGYFSFFYFLIKKDFSFYTWRGFKDSLRYSWLVLVFVSVSIFVDHKIGFPEDMNIAFPESLLFYPVIGFIVEVIFHLIPLSMLLLLSSNWYKANNEKQIWISAIIVALIEPSYQVFFMGGYATWALIIIWLNLFLFNLSQLQIFKKYDFISMYAFRLMYYLIWHILWGHFRLDSLF